MTLAQSPFGDGEFAFPSLMVLDSTRKYHRMTSVENAFANNPCPSSRVKRCDVLWDAVH